MSKLESIFLSLSKKSMKWSTYFPCYERHLSKFVGKAPKILEIGVLNGGSLEMWLKYFGEGTSVVGVDINPGVAEVDYDGDVSIEVGNQGDKNFWNYVKSKYTEFDIIIDDGSHMMNDQIVTLESMYPHLKCGGVFVIEDTHTSYWDRWGGSLHGEGTFIEYAKSMTDIMNNNEIRDREQQSKLDSMVENFPNLYSVSFYRSIVFFEKEVLQNFVCLEV